jgi:PBSX family phage terminase large subunit
MSNERPGLSYKQRKSVVLADKRINLWHGSVRSGKTVGSIWRWAQFVANNPEGDLLMTGKTIDALKRNVISPLLDLVGDSAKYFPGKRELHMFGKTIYAVGASDERSEGKIRGSTLGGVYGDEITLWPESFFKMCLSRMSVEGAKFFGSTNPDNPNHWLYKGYIKRRHELDMSLFHFVIDDNPFLSRSYVQSLKKEYTGLWYKRFILGKWCVAEGAIYDFFDEKVHTISEVPEATHYYVGIDYGTTNPCVFILYGVNNNSHPKIWAEKEYYYDPTERKKQRTDGEFSQDFIKFIAPVKHKIRGIYCDPSAESFQLQLRRDGIINMRDAENEVLDGIRTVARMFVTGEYAIYKYGCPKLIDEMYAYAWDPKSQSKGEDIPLKTHDHAQDNQRYVLHTVYGTGSYALEKMLK